MGRRNNGPLARLAGLAVLSLAACSAMSGSTTEELRFEARAVYDFADFAAGSGEPAPVEGRLYLPEEGPLRGAAILSHGAAGPGARQSRMAAVLAENGVAALLLDHFGPRGVGSVAREQLRVPEQTMIADILAARDLLADRLALAPERIGAIGWSKGATAVTLAAVARLSGFAAPEGPPLGFAAAFYPFCGFALDKDALGTPLLLLLGEDDDWTPAGPCLRQAEAWKMRGQPVRWEIYEDAEHGFDSRARPGRSDRVITVRDTSPRCTLTVDTNGRTLTLDGTHSLTSPEGRAAFLGDCGVRGAGFAGNAAARAASREGLLAFIDDVLR
ncbi:MAG: prolyl oligopeptidase family serine peptidase [Pseudomonadota bacterium]